MVILYNMLISSIFYLSVIDCLPISKFYPYGSINGDSSLSANDDGSTSKIQLSVNFTFFGSSYDSIFVNNNGDVTFGEELRQFTSEPFPINGSHKIIAPFWTDIDTRQGGQLWYRTTTRSSVLQQGTTKIRSLFPNILDFVASWMMVVTWERVARYGCSNTFPFSCSQRNTFQLVLITDGTHSFAVFNYYTIEWTHLSQVGFNAGDGENYFSVPGSMNDTVLDQLPQMSNIGVPGQFVFRLDENKITNADTIDECLSSPCTHGNCSNEYLYYECTCEPGYTGINCENDIDECESSPCVYGNCSDHLNHYVCICQEGYTGSGCQIDIDECAVSPCLYGNCSDLVNSYLCSCEPGYSGANCDQDIDECQSSPCNHGNCTDYVNSYSCQCHAGYTGTHCLIDIDECASSPCVNGNCTDQANGYLCSCENGYTGAICETEVANLNTCESSPCVHGSCIDQFNNYHCICDTGYYGRRCSNFDVVYLTPLLVGILLVIVLLVAIMWKKCKRNDPTKIHPNLHRNISLQGSDLQNQPPRKAI